MKSRDGRGCRGREGEGEEEEELRRMRRSDVPGYDDSSRADWCLSAFLPEASMMSHVAT